MTFRHYLQSQGRQTFLVTNTSVLGIFPAPPLACYSATKAALHALTLSLRMQLDGTGVNVIEILPP
jgi:short-subunit dehydrogenase involved in D-alanine esterification of teichoic acids